MNEERLRKERLAKEYEARRKKYPDGYGDFTDCKHWRECDLFPSGNRMPKECPCDDFEREEEEDA